MHRLRVMKIIYLVWEAAPSRTTLMTDAFPTLIVANSGTERASNVQITYVNAMDSVIYNL
jgi:hypothetical protein